LSESIIQPFFNTRAHYMSGIRDKSDELLAASMLSNSFVRAMLLN